jgi:hypothetical protein
MTRAYRLPLSSYRVVWCLDCALQQRPGPSNPDADPERHTIPATGVPTDPVAVKGKPDFESKCLARHSIGGGDELGPTCTA